MFDLTSAEDFPTTESELKTLRVRVQLAQAFVSLMQKAYAANRNYGVDYHSLPEYQDTTLIDEGNKLCLTAGQDKFIEWMRRVEHGLNAAIRRKQFTLHTDNTPRG